MIKENEILSGSDSKTLVIFDLDDTLDPERSYVESGFKAVAAMLAEKFDWEAAALLTDMLSILDNTGRGAVFDDVLKKRCRYTKGLVKECIHCYRHHQPDIELNPGAKSLLESYSGPLYLVTDGHKVSQQKKIQALRLERYFKHCYITHRYGIKNAKPSLHCFDLIRRIEQVEWKNMAYVGDNPAKDFVNLNQKGAKTVRLMQGYHKNVRAKAGFDAQIKYDSISDFSRASIKLISKAF